MKSLKRIYLALRKREGWDYFARVGESVEMDDVIRMFREDTCKNEVELNGRILVVGPTCESW